MKLYRWLLHLYPNSFRNEYGAEMEWLFAERQAGARNAAALAALWLMTLLDVMRNATLVHLDILRQDVRYTLRSLRNAPGFTATVILVAGIGIGATTAVFTVTDMVLIRPLPFADPERLVKLWENKPGYPQMELSPLNYRDWKAASVSFETMGAYSGLSANMVGQGEPERLEGATLTADVLPLLGVKPAMGRLFTAADDAAGAPGTLLLSHQVWQNVFGADPTVIGKSVRLDDGPYTVIGVMPQGFQFPTREAEIWTPMRLGAVDFADRNNNYLHVVARLKPGIQLEQVREEMKTIARRLELAYPKENERTGATVNLMRDQVSNRARLLLWALCGAALCLLLIACANVANLLLARALSRRKELAVRAALGAGQERLFRQLFTESALLALLGAGLGLLLAQESLPLLASLVPPQMPVGEVRMDGRVLAFALAMAALTGIGFGVLPAMWAYRSVAADGLREGARSGIGGRKERLRAALVIVEIAVSLVLLVSSGLLIRALEKLQATDPGFRAGGVLTLRTALPSPKYDRVAKQEDFFGRVLGEIRRLPGVTDAAYISFLPMTMRGGIWPVSVGGRTLSRAENHTASMRFVTPGFFPALRIPLRAGRDVSESDARERLFTAVVSRSFAERYWPGEDPLGRRFEIGFSQRTVVGVVDDVKVRGLESISEPQVYLPYKQTADGAFSFYVPKDLVIRAEHAQALAPAVRAILRRVDPEQPVSSVRMLSEIVEADSAPRRTQLRMLGVFTGVAILLAAIGIHGLLAFAVSTRTQEIGVRMALGAQRRNVLGMVLSESFALSAVGAVCGMALGNVTGRWMESLLYGVAPDDPITFLSAAGVCLGMTMVGSLAPALRAMAVDPMVALKAE